MKKSTTPNLILAAAALIAGHAAAQTQPETIPVLGEAAAKEMDADGDGRVSKVEFLEFGAAAMKRKGIPLDVFALEAKFKAFDRNQDGFITSEDPTALSPEAALVKRLQGRWVGSKESGSKLELVFMEDFKADFVQRGISMRQKAVDAGGEMTYKLINPAKEPVALDFVARDQVGNSTRIQCIIRLVDDDHLQLRMASGGAYARRPTGFPEGGAMDMITLARNP